MDRRPRDAHLFGDLANRPPVSIQLHDASAIEHQLRPAADAPLLAGSSETGMHTLAEPDALLLGDHRQDREHRVFEDAHRIEILLGEGSPVNAVLGEALEMLKGFEHALTAEAVEAPEEHHVELALAAVGEKLLELFTVAALAAGAIDVLMDHRPVLRRGELPELLKLIGHILPAVAGADSGIERRSHMFSSLSQNQLFQRQHWD